VIFFIRFYHLHTAQCSHFSNIFLINVRFSEMYGFFSKFWPSCNIFTQDSTRIWETLFIVYSYLQDSTRIWETMYIVQFIFTVFYADMGNYVYYTIHISRTLRGYGKLCILYIHISRILREYGKLQRVWRL